MIYLDNAATTMIKPESVGRAMLTAMNSAASPGRGGHRPAMRAAEIVFHCRENAAELFNVPEPERIVFTMNATHALNIAIRSLAHAGSRVLVSGYEHNSVTRPLAQLGARVDIASSRLFDREEILKAFAKKISGADLVICTHVSNVFGFILPVYEIAELCRRHKVPLIVDASQSAGILDVDYLTLGADFIAMPGHKSLFGPQGTGLLICGRAGEPLLCGGSGSDSIPQVMPDYLPDRMEAGTHNVPGIAGLSAGISYVRGLGLRRIFAHEQELLGVMLSGLEGCRGIELFAGPEGSQSGVLSFRCIGPDCEDLAQGLADRGICVRGGLHCAPFAHRSAGTLGTGTVRASFSPFTDAAGVRKAAAAIRELLHSTV